MDKANGVGAHQSAKMRTDEWLTPPNILHALGDFDLDPCSPVDRPWDTAKKHYTIYDDGLRMEWEGRVWLNPPYSSDCHRWMNKMAYHNNGIALIFARTETDMFFQHVWGKATSILFLQGRLYFYTVQGKKARANSGAPSVLISYGRHNADILQSCGLPGQHLFIK